MIDRAPTSEPIELHLADGGRIVISFATIASQVRASDRLVETLLRADGSEHDVERAIAADIQSLGLTCTCSTDGNPTVIVIG